MGEVVVSEFVTLDGVFEDPGGSEQTAHGGWAFKVDQGPEGMQFKLDELMAADVLLLGRRTYEGFAAAWPSIPDDEAGFARKMNEMPKVVVSSTLTEPSWNATVAAPGDLGSTVAGLKERYAGDVLVAGSAQLVRALVGAGLVDELRLMVFPLVLGTGKRLFDGGEAAAFEVAEAVQRGGVSTLVLRRA